MVISILLLGSACQSYEESALEREVRAAAGGDIVIGVVWPTSIQGAAFINGVELAVEELRGENGILGRNIRTVVRDDENSTDIAHIIATEFAADPEMVAVIGHRTSNTAIRSSITYEYNRMVFISPAATSLLLTRHGFSSVFRTTPNNIAQVWELLYLAFLRGHKKVVLLNSRNSYGTELAELFLKHFSDLAMDVVSHRTFFDGTTHFREIIAEFQGEDIDCIFLASGLQEGALVIKQLREMGVTAPIFGTDTLESKELWKIAGKAAGGTIVPTVYRGNKQNRRVRKFNRFYMEEYGETPSTWAAQGYDAMMMLASAIEAGKSSMPVVIGTTLRYMKPWMGVTGKHAFTKNGELVGKKFYFKILENGQFTHVKKANAG